MVATAVAMLASRRTTRVSTPANGLLAVVLLRAPALVPQCVPAGTSFPQFDGYFLWLVAYSLIIYDRDDRAPDAVDDSGVRALQPEDVPVRNARRGCRSGSAFALGNGRRSRVVPEFRRVRDRNVRVLPDRHLSRTGASAVVAEMEVPGCCLGIAGTSLAGMVVSSSRGALMGGAAVIVFMLVRSKYKMRALVAGIVVGALFFLAIPPEQKQRLSESGSDETSQLQAHILEERHQDDKRSSGVRGRLRELASPTIGIISTAGSRSAHNIFIQASSELGYSGCWHSCC